MSGPHIPPADSARLTERTLIHDGVRIWRRFQPLDVEDADFAPLGEAFAGTGAEVQGQVGAGHGRLMRARELVEFAVPWLEASRDGRP